MGDLGGGFVPELLGDADVHLDALVHEALERLEGLAGAASEPRVIGSFLEKGALVSHVT